MSDDYEPVAPGRLGVVEALLNTHDLESGDDALEDLASLEQWLRHYELLEADERVQDPEDLERTVALREALRELLVARHDERVADAAAAAVLERTADRAAFTLRLSGNDVSVVPRAQGLDRVLGELLATIQTAMLDGTWSRLKVCSSDECRWAYYDRSQNRSRSWCSMRVCGNRVKVRRFRERQADRS